MANNLWSRIPASRKNLAEMQANQGVIDAEVPPTAPKAGTYSATEGDLYAEPEVLPEPFKLPEMNPGRAPASRFRAPQFRPAPPAPIEQKPFNSKEALYQAIDSDAPPAEPSVEDVAQQAIPPKAAEQYVGPKTPVYDATDLPPARTQVDPYELLKQLQEKSNSKLPHKGENFTRQTTETLMLNPADLQILDEVALKNPAIAAQKAALTADEERLAQYEKASKDPWLNADLKPLMNLADVWYGQKGKPSLTEGYTSPKSRDERFDALSSYRDKIQKQRNELSERMTAYEKLAANGGQDKTGLAELFGIPTANGRGAASSDRLLNKMYDDYNKSVTNPYQTRQEQFNQIQDNLATNNYADIMAIMSQFARGISGEKGVLTDNDINRLIPANFHGSMARFVAYLNENPNAPMDPAWVKDLQASVVRARTNAQKVYTELHQTKTDMYRANPAWSSAHEQTAQAIRAQLDRGAPEGYTDPHPPAAKRGGAKGAGKSAPAAPAKIRVSNGKETLEIDSSDLEHAVKDGFKKVN